MDTIVLTDGKKWSRKFVLKGGHNCSRGCQNCPRGDQNGPREKWLFTVFPTQRLRMAFHHLKAFQE